MSRLISAAALALALFLSGHAVARAEAPETIESFLAEHHVEDTPAGLRVAMSNSDPGVRAAAAVLLAQKIGTRSIPFLEAALANEPRVDVQMTLAATLNRLGDRTGRTWLVDKCKQADAEPLTRMLSANRLLEGHSDDCTGAVIDTLGGKADHDTTSQALNYLRASRTPPAASLRPLKIKLEGVLNDPRSKDHWNASRILAVIGDAASIAPMQKAIHNETDTGYRHFLEDDLRTLEARLRAAAWTP